MISNLYIFVAEIPECSSYGAPSTFLAFSGRPAKNTGMKSMCAGNKAFKELFDDLI